MNYKYKYFSRKLNIFYKKEQRNKHYSPIFFLLLTERAHLRNCLCLSILHKRTRVGINVCYIAI